MGLGFKLLLTIVLILDFDVELSLPERRPRNMGNAMVEGGGIEGAYPQARYSTIFHELIAQYMTALVVLARDTLCHTAFLRSSETPILCCSPELRRSSS